MADDRMKHDDAQRNMGGTSGQQDKNLGQQSPGRSGQSGQQSGQHAGGQQGGQFGVQKNARDMDDDDDLAMGGKGPASGQNRGGQNR
jgi:hypothetical protein